MADVEESPAQRAARVRREKREKKILEGGASRLEKITGVSGRSAALAPGPETSKPIDRSDSPSPRISSAATQPTHASSDASPVAAARESLRRSETPEPGEQRQEFMQQVQQMLSSFPQSPGGQGPSVVPGQVPSDGLPPSLASLLGGGGAPPQAPARAAYLWRVLHLLASLALGAYILWAYAFTGAERRQMRDRAAGLPLNADGNSPIDFAALKNDRVTVFSLFASVELALQSARYLLADRSAETAGLVGTVAGFLPPPWGGRLRLANQYIGIWSSLVGDAMVVIFLLGVAAWWSGAGA